MGKKKKFIDKKNSVTFRLLHRSQKDPLVTDQDAPQFVLQEIEDKPKDSNEEEKLKYGIYFDDDYDYMQHLRERGGGQVALASQSIVSKTKQKKGISLPSSVFQSDVEEKVGVLNKAAPQGLTLDFDPDLPEVLAAMETASENPNDDWLDDDFVMKANEGDDAGSEGGDEMFSDEDEYDEERDELMSLEREETKSRFTEYSMTSSVMRRNEQLTLLDDRFEELFAEYDDSEIGALDTEEIEGYVEPETNVLEKFIKDFDCINSREDIVPQRPILYEDGNSSSEENFEYLEVKPKEKWDCESVLSTYSNIYNHPKIIDAPQSKIKINSMGVPVNKNKLTASALAKHDGSKGNKATGPGSIASAISLLSIRSKNETPIEKKSRKKAFRDHKRERRIERKLNTEAFKDEKRKMEKMMAQNKSRFQVPL
ncbi:protein LTV1 homolog [Halyomorpha halys]|uniref:protein LTV1 homolog n=1 Tax=Halyomorpha halys TaxID=286706 RepID=UPI0006D51BFC|nr:protein LTV1 homolog [Halyomorpha halys]